MPALWFVASHELASIGNTLTNKTKPQQLSLRFPSDGRAIAFRQSPPVPSWVPVPAINPNTGTTASRGPSNAAVGGAIVGSLVGATIIILLLVCCCYRSHRRGGLDQSSGGKASRRDSPSPSPSPPPPRTTQRNEKRESRVPPDRGPVPLPDRRLPPQPPPQPPNPNHTHDDARHTSSRLPTERIILLRGEMAKRRRRKLDLPEPEDAHPLELSGFPIYDPIPVHDFYVNATDPTRPPTYLAAPKNGMGSIPQSRLGSSMPMNPPRVYFESGSQSQRAGRGNDRRRAHSYHHTQTTVHEDGHFKMPRRSATFQEIYPRIHPRERWRSNIL